MSSGVKSSGAVQLMDALVSEKGSKMIVFKPKSPRRALGGSPLLIRMFDCRNLQKGAAIGNRDKRDVLLECFRVLGSFGE
jgi:hypothetical protein